jgi:hypothetical protein
VFIRLAFYGVQLLVVAGVDAASHALLAAGAPPSSTQVTVRVDTPFMQAVHAPGTQAYSWSVAAATHTPDLHCLPAPQDEPSAAGAFHVVSQVLLMLQSSEPQSVLAAHPVEFGNWPPLMPLH